MAARKRFILTGTNRHGFASAVGIRLASTLSEVSGEVASPPRAPEVSTATTKKRSPSVLPATESTVAPTTRPVIGSREPPGRGTMVGPYKLLRWLGSGGMGIVWEAVELETGRRVALKCLSKTMLSDPQYVQRFIREAQLAARIDHPKVTFIFDAGEHNGMPYIAMELMPGTTLADVLKAGGPMPVQRAVDAMIDIVDGLSAAHRIGLIHRDVKPSNCFLAADDSVKIGDFGLSKSMAPSEVSLTQTGTFMGTPSFPLPSRFGARSWMAAPMCMQSVRLCTTC